MNSIGRTTLLPFHGCGTPAEADPAAMDARNSSTLLRQSGQNGLRRERWEKGPNLGRTCGRVPNNSSLSPWWISVVPRLIDAPCSRLVCATASVRGGCLRPRPSDTALQGKPAVRCMLPRRPVAGDGGVRLRIERRLVAAEGARAALRLFEVRLDRGGLAAAEPISGTTSPRC